MKRHKPKVYIEVEGGSLAEIMDWFISVSCPYDVRSIDYPNGIVRSVQETVVGQADEIETLLKRTDSLEAALDEQTGRADRAEQEIEELLSPSSRRPPPHFKLPNERPSITHEFYIGLSSLGHGCITAGFYPGTEEVGEIFVKMSVLSPEMDDGMRDKDPRIAHLKRQVSDLTYFLKGILDQLAIAVSIGLQRGIPLEVFVEKFKHTKFPPDGQTRNQQIPRCTSIIDYLFRWLSIRFLEEQ